MRRLFPHCLGRWVVVLFLCLGGFAANAAPADIQLDRSVGSAAVSDGGCCHGESGDCGNASEPAACQGYCAVACVSASALPALQTACSAAVGAGSRFSVAAERASGLPTAYLTPPPRRFA